MIRLEIQAPLPRKNARGRLAHGRVITPKKTLDWYAALASEYSRHHHEPICSGAWSIRISVYETRMRHLDVDLPLGDVDSTVSAVLDGLQRCGALDDDARFVDMRVAKFLGAKPLIVVALRRLVSYDQKEAQ